MRSYLESFKANFYMQLGMITVPLVLYVVLMGFMAKDFAMVYGTAYKNAETVKSDEKIVGVLSWETTDDDKLAYTDIDGEEHEVEMPELSLVMDEKHIAYYSEESNMLLQPVDEEYVEDFLLGYNLEAVFMELGFISIMLLIACINGGFVLFSKVRVLVVYVVSILLGVCMSFVFINMFK